MTFAAYDLHALFLEEIPRAGLVVAGDSLLVASLDDHTLMPVISVSLHAIDPAMPLEERPPEARLTLVAIPPRDVSLHILYRCFITHALRGDYRTRLNEVYTYFGQILNSLHQDRAMFSSLTVRAELAASTDGEEPEWYASLWPLRIGVYARMARLSAGGEADMETMDSLRARVPLVLKHTRAQLVTLSGAVASWRSTQAT